MPPILNRVKIDFVKMCYFELFSFVCFGFNMKRPVIFYSLQVPERACF